MCKLFCKYRTEHFVHVTPKADTRNEIQRDVSLIILPDIVACKCRHCIHGSMLLEV
jgi:hypothetical protein